MAKKEAKKIVKIACEGAATLPLEDLEEFQGELKTLSEENAARLRRVILRDGFSEPFSIWRNEGHNYILNGHQRFHVLHMLVDDGYVVGPLPVSWVEADSFKQAKVKVLDLTSQYGEITVDGLEMFLDDSDLDFSEIKDSLRFPEIDLDDIRLLSDTEPEDESAVGEMIDRAEELNEKWGVERGQIWEIGGKAGKHRVMCGDATDEGDVALLLTGAKPYLMVTDPPYGVEYDPQWRDERLNSPGSAWGRYFEGDTVVDWAPWFPAWNAMVFYVWHAGVHGAEVALGLMEIGLEIRAQIIWRKHHFAISRGHYNWQHEPCYYAVKKGSTAQWQGDDNASTV